MDNNVKPRCGRARVGYLLANMAGGGAPYGRHVVAVCDRPYGHRGPHRGRHVKDGKVVWWDVDLGGEREAS